MPALDPEKLTAAMLEVKLDDAKLAAATAELNAPPPPEPPIGASIDRLLGQGGSGFNRGLATVAGMPVDAVNAGMGAIGIPTSDKPFLGSEYIKGLLPEPQQPQTRMERMVDRVGEEIGANVPMLGGGLALRGASAVASPTLQTLQSALAGTSAAKLAKVETLLAASSGVGAGVAREVAPDSATAELAGQLLGTFGPVAATSVVKRLRSSLAGRLVTPNPDDLQREVGEIIAGALDESPNSIRDSLVMRDEIRETVPGFSPTTAQITDSPSLIAMERAQTARSNDFKNLFRGNVSDSGDAIRDAFDRIPAIPRGAAGIEDTQATIRRALDERIRVAQERAAERIGLRDRLSTPEAGRVVRDELMRAEAEFREASTRLFENVDRADAVRLPFRDIAEEAFDQQTTRPEFERMTDTPDVVGEIQEFATRDIGRIVDEQTAALQAQGIEPNAEAIRRAALDDTTASFRDLRALRSRLMRDVREELNVPAPNRNRIRKLNRIASRVDEALDQLGNSEEFPEAAQAYRQANAFYRDGVQRLRSGPAREVMRTDATGRLRVPESDVAARFFLPGERGADAAQAFRAAIQSPEGVRAMQDAALNSLANTADTEGRLSATRLAKWRQQHRSFLDQMPEINAETQTIERAQRALEQRQLVAQRGVEEVERSAAGLLLNADPEKAVSRVLSGTRPAQGLRQITGLVSGDRQAMNGLRRAVWDHIGQAAEGAERSIHTEAQLLHPSKLRALIRRNEGALRALYSEAELRQLRTILHASEVVQRSGKTAVMNSSATAEHLGSLALDGPRKWLARTWGAVRPGKLRLATHIATEWVTRATRELTQDQLNEYLQRALIDPEYAETLVLHARGVRPEVTAAAIRGHLANLGGEHRDELAASATEKAGALGILARDAMQSRADKRLQEFIPAVTKPPPVPRPVVPPKPKPPKPFDVTKDLARGQIGPADLADLARAGGR